MRSSVHEENVSSPLERLDGNSRSLTKDRTIVETAIRELDRMATEYRHRAYGETDYDRAYSLGELAKASDTLKLFIQGHGARRQVSRQAAHAIRLLDRASPGSVTPAVGYAYKARRGEGPIKNASQ